MNYPTVSLIIPTLNEEDRIGACLESIFGQEYPKDKLEVIIVDDKSIDNTIKIVKKYPVKILISGARHGEISKMIGFKAAKGELMIYVDADQELIGTDWIKKMIKPLLENPKIIGSFTRNYAKKSHPPLERYMAFDPLQRDSIYQFFSPSMEETIVKKEDGYFICEYSLDKIPVSGCCLYRRKEVLDLVSKFNMFLELDFLVLLVRNGWNNFAYVPSAGYYHHHASSLAELIHKRKYNVTKVYLTHVQNKLYIWFDLSKKKDILKIIFWIIYANLFFPSIIVGFIKSLRYKDWVGMYEPIVNILITDVIVFAFISQKTGRNFILKIFGIKI